MKMSEGFELVNIAEEHLVVPVGEKADKLKGLIVLSPAAAFLLEKMKKDLTIDDLVSLLTNRYDVNIDKAQKDINEMVDTLRSLGLLTD